MPDFEYQKLQEQLDQYSVGYPSTESGIEIKILKKLFTEKEAEIFLHLSLVPETPEVIASRCGSDPTIADIPLNGMYKKGLVYRHIKGETVKYGAVPFIEGIFEYQVKGMDRELAQMFEDYAQEALNKNLTETKPMLIHRPIAINKTIDISFPIPTYENSHKIIQEQKLIAVADCVCRVQKGLIEKECNKPLETCFMFGAPAKYFIESGMGRQVSIDEAFHILDVSEEAGLVTMPFNTQTPANLCNCCPDCCIIINNLKKFPYPAVMVKAYHRAVIDQNKCEACYTCLDRCPMEAISMGKEHIETINPGRCIGCGLCVSACPTGAIHLEGKSKSERFEPPETGMQFYKEMAQKRGKSLVPLAMRK